METRRLSRIDNRNVERWGAGVDLVLSGVIEPPEPGDVEAAAELALAACGGVREKAEGLVRGLLAAAPSGPARRLLVALMRGLSPRAACGAAGIGMASLERTCATHPAFAELVDAARSIGAARLEAVIEDAAMRGEWKAASSLLRSAAQATRPGIGSGPDPWAAVVAGWRPAEVRQSTEERDARRRRRARARARARVVDGEAVSNPESTEDV